MYQIYCPKGYTVLDIDVPLVTNPKSVASMALKLMKSKEQQFKLHNKEIPCYYHLELYQIKEQRNLEQIKDYYQALIKLQWENSEELEGMARVYQFSTIVVKERKYVRIIRDYLQNKKPLSDLIGIERSEYYPLDLITKLIYSQKILATMQYLHDQGLPFKQISPYCVFTCDREVDQRRQNKQQIKIVDTLLNHYLKGNKKTKEINYYYLHSSMLLQRLQILPTLKYIEDYWSMGLMLLSMVYKINLVKKYMNHENFTLFWKSEKEKLIAKQKIEQIIQGYKTQMNDVGTQTFESIIELALSLLNNSYYDLRTTVKSGFRVIENILKKNQIKPNQLEDIKKQFNSNLEKDLKNDKPIYQTVQVSSKNEFLVTELEKIDDEIIQSLRKTIYGQKILKIWTPQKVKCFGSIEYLKPSGTAETVVYDNQNTYMADAALSCGLKVKIFFTTKGWCPINQYCNKLIGTNYNQIKSTDLSYQIIIEPAIIGRPQKLGNRMICSQLDTTGYNNKTIQDLQMRLSGFDLDGLKTYFPQQVQKINNDETFKKMQINCRKKIVSARWMPLLSSQARPQYMNLNANQINDQQLSLLKIHPFKIFRDIKYLSLADNKIKDDGFRYLCEASLRDPQIPRRTPSFTQLKTLKLSNNLIESLNCLKANGHNFKELSYLHLQNNFISEITVHSTESLKKIIIVFIEGNRLSQNTLKQLKQLQPWTRKYIYQ